MSTVKQLTHIVFATKHREMTINAAHCEDLYRFITYFLQKYHCYLLRTNGIENHIHILVDIHPSISLSTLVQMLKHDSSVWMQGSGLFPKWKGWCEGYFACSVSPKSQDAVIEYIKFQKEHHNRMNFEDEFIKLNANAGIEYDGFMLE